MLLTLSSSVVLTGLIKLTVYSGVVSGLTFCVAPLFLFTCEETRILSRIYKRAVFSYMSSENANSNPIEVWHESREREWPPWINNLEDWWLLRKVLPTIVLLFLENSSQPPSTWPQCWFAKVFEDAQFCTHIYLQIVFEILDNVEAILMTIAKIFLWLERLWQVSLKVEQQLFFY